MTKKTYMYLIVIVVFAMLFIPFRVLPMFSPMRNIAEQARVPAGSYDMLSISTDIPSVQIVPTAGTAAEFSLTGRSSTSYSLDVSSRGNHVEVEVKRRISSRLNILNFRQRSENMSLKVHLPESFARSLEVKTVSGSIRAEHVSAPVMKYTSVSGAIRLDSLKAEDLTAKSTSGGVRTAASTSSRFDLQTTSGAVMLSDASGEIYIKTVSGAAAAALNKVNGPVEITSVSGAVQLSVPENTDAKVSLSSTTGSLHSAHALQDRISEPRSLQGVLGSGDYSITLKTTSGAVSIK